MKLNIRKPFDDGTVGIYDRTVEQAIKRNEAIELTTPDGEYTINPKDWKKTSKKIFRYFKLDRPMLLYVNNPKRFIQGDQTVSIPDDARYKLLNAWKQINK